MARTKDAVLTPGQKGADGKKYLDFVKPSTYGNKANPSSCNSLYDDVENPELRATVEKVAATTPYERKHQRTRLNRHRIHRSASVARSERECNFYDDVEKSWNCRESCATTPYREETSTKGSIATESTEAHQWQAAQGDIRGVSADLPPSSKD